MSDAKTLASGARPTLRNVAIIAAAFVFAFAGFWVSTAPRMIAAGALPPHKPNFENGRMMFLAGDCAACHASPRQGDLNRLGGGLKLVSKFGTFYAPNISADASDGIGSWSEAQFVTAMKEGVSPDGRHLYPIFPYTSFRNMRNEDVRDLFAYLKTLPPVSGRAPEASLAFPYNLRRLLGGWKLLFLDTERFQLDRTKSVQWNRGAYLVNGPAHCAECHSPRNRFGAVIPGKRFSGTPNSYGVLGFPNITQAKLGSWSEDAIAEMLRSGFTPDGDRVGGPMTEVVRSTSQLTDQDRLAMAVYIKSLAPVGAPAKKPHS